MSLIDVPGDELMRVHDLLQRVEDMIYGMPIGSTQGLGELGQPELNQAADTFEGRWKYGRYVVGKDLKTVRDAAKTIVDAFQKTDEHAVDKLPSQSQQS